MKADTASAPPPVRASDGAWMSFVAAFVDTLGFIALFGVFTAHVTGNIVLIGASLANRHGEFTARVLTLPAFMLAVAATYLMARALRRWRLPAARILLCFEAVLLLATVGVAHAVGQFTDETSLATIVAALVLAVAMGIQNAVMRMTYSSLPPTTAMTGNVTLLVLDLMTVLTHPRGAEEHGAARARLTQLWPSMTAFFVGTACAALAYAWIEFFSLLIPAACCLIVAIRAGTRL